MFLFYLPWLTIRGKDSGDEEQFHGLILKWYSHSILAALVPLYQISIFVRSFEHFKLVFFRKKDGILLHIANEFFG